MHFPSTWTAEDQNLASSSHFRTCTYWHFSGQLQKQGRRDVLNPEPTKKQVQAIHGTLYGEALLARLSAAAVDRGLGRGRMVLIVQRRLFLNSKQLRGAL